MYYVCLCVYSTKYARELDDRKPKDLTSSLRPHTLVA